MPAKHRNFNLKTFVSYLVHVYFLFILSFFRKFHFHRKCSKWGERLWRKKNVEGIRHSYVSLPVVLRLYILRLFVRPTSLSWLSLFSKTKKKRKGSWVLEIRKYTEIATKLPCTWSKFMRPQFTRGNRNFNSKKIQVEARISHSWMLLSSLQKRLFLCTGNFFSVFVFIVPLRKEFVVAEQHSWINRLEF